MNPFTWYRLEIENPARRARGAWSLVAAVAVVLLATRPALAERDKQLRVPEPPTASEAAAGIPTDVNGFTSYVADRLEHALPEVRVSIAGPLTIVLRLSTGRLLQANLDRVHGICEQHPADCERTLASYVASAGEALDRGNAQPDETLLRAAVRNTEYVEGTLADLAAKSGNEPVAETLGGGLSLVLVFNFAQTVRATGTADLERLGLSRDEAIAIATQNVATQLRPLPEVVQDVPAGSFGVIEGDPFESSRLILHDDWTWLADRLNGPLIVAAPAQDVVLYGSDYGPEAIAVMAEFAEKVVSESGWALAPAVFRWSPTGWEPVSP